MKAAKAKFDPKLFLAALGDAARTAEWAKGVVVFRQGDPADALFYVHGGKIKVTTLSRHGKEAVVAILGPGDFFGEGCMAGQPLRISSASVIEDATLSRLGKHAVTTALRDRPEFAEVFMAYILARNIRIEADLIDQLFNSSEKRLARLLLLLANFGQDGAPQPVTMPISQETLAEMIGTTRSRVSFFMNKFRRLGFVSYNGHLEVHSALLGVVLVDDLSVRLPE